MKQFIVSHFSRIAAVLTLCALTLAASKNEKTASPIDLNAYAGLMSNRITRVEDLINRYYEQQDTFALLIPPGLELLNQPGNPDTLVIDLNSKELDATFTKALSSARPVYRNSVPAYEITLQETVQGTIEIRDNADQLLYTDPAPIGYVIPYELLFRQSQNPMLYYPELARYRLKTKLTLLPEQYVEHYLYAQARIAEAAALLQEEEGEGEGGGMMLMREGMEEEVYISGMREETNGLLLELNYPESYSGTVWSAYSYDAQDTLSETFMGLESVWTLASSNIVLTGETSVAWIDTRPMGFDEQTNPVHRFYAFGANTDSDNDGLNDGYELFVTKTNPDDPDSDGDGLNDGWEVENGLDPLSSEWDDGADGDPDRDGLSNLEEFQLNRNPQGFDDVIALAPQNVSIEKRFHTVIRTKFGEPGLINANKRYLHREIAFEWQEIYDPEVCDRLRAFEYNNYNDLLVRDPRTGVFEQEGQDGSDFEIWAGPGCTCSHKEYVLRSWSNRRISAVVIPSSDSCDEEPIPGILDMDICMEDDYGHSGTYDIQSDTYRSKSESGQSTEEPFSWAYEGSLTLDSEYTTVMLKAIAREDLQSMECGSWDSLDWGDERWVSVEDPDCETNKVIICTNRVAVYRGPMGAWQDVSENELNIDLRKMQFRFKVMDTTAAVYRVSWVELYHPEDTNEPTQIVGLRSTVFEGSGSQEEIYSPEFVLEPPSEDGWVEPIVLRVELIDATSPVAGTSGNSPPFEGHKPWPFDSSKTPPDKHMVVFYNDVIDSSFNVQDFDVTLTANILPSSITDDMLNEVWSKISGPGSGSFNRTDTFEVKYQNPKQGGVYRFDFNLGFSGFIKSEANVVLPLAGAEVSSIVGADLARADAFAAIANSKYPTKVEKLLRMPFWFWIGGNGDYLGRPNNSSSRTCVHYNQMNPSTGMGAACTWFGTSVLVAKLSNFMYAYAARKLGFTLEEIEDGGAFGTDDDDATLRCYYLGWVIANGATYSSQIPSNMPYIWENSDSEEHKIVWPNAGGHNYDWFLSPGFLDLSAADI